MIARLASLVVLLVLAAGCGSSAATTAAPGATGAPAAGTVAPSPGATSSGSPGAASASATAASASGSLPLPVPSEPGPTFGAPSSPGAGVVPSGNAVRVPAPPDTPASIRSLGPVPSCGAIISFEVDPDVSPRPTLPSNLTGSSDAAASKACLIGAWQLRRPAELVTQETTDEQDEIYTIYRLPGDGTLDLIVRLHSHTEQTVTWNESHCRGLTLQEGQVTPVDCDVEQPVR